TTLTWGPYLWFHMLRVATSTLSGIVLFNSWVNHKGNTESHKVMLTDCNIIFGFYLSFSEENKMSEEAERQHQEQNKPQAEAPVQTDQPGATACSSFVNVNFENEGDCPP
ncbi:F177A protein, partial [Horornis vulcanius]|nr:F177A protein [Horornis vulcanius]